MPISQRPKSAAQKVFETTEVLEIIILQLPVEDVWLIQRVTKLCRSIITETKAGRAALVLSPLDRKVYNEERYPIESFEVYPYYGERLKLHPALHPKRNRGITRESTCSPTARRMQLVLPPTTSRKLERYKNDYISFPPVTTLKVYYGKWPSMRTSEGAHLRIPEGIKIKDFIAVQHAMSMREEHLKDCGMGKRCKCYEYLFKGVLLMDYDVWALHCEYREHDWVGLSESTLILVDMRLTPASSKLRAPARVV